MGYLTHPWLVRSCQVITGLVFVAAALPKIGDAASFARSIHNFRLVPVALENPVAITLPWVELLVGLVLVLNVRERGLDPFRAGTALARSGAALAAGLLAVFTVAVAQAVIRDLDIDCGCFGTADAAKVGLVKLAENAGLIVVAWIGALRPGRGRL